MNASLLVRSLQHGLCALLIGLTSCGGQDPRPEPPKPLPPHEIVGDGIRLHRVDANFDGNRSDVYLYLPAELPTSGGLPCVLIAPAGTRLWHGSTLGSGGLPERLPFAERGFVVVSYAISGAVPDDFSVDEARAAIGDFVEARGGLDDARSALDFALRYVPEIDESRIYTSGHSSAATLSLQVAEDDERIRACIAFAPASDLENRIDGMTDYLPADLCSSDLRAWATRHSPLNIAERLACPVFLFHAEDDRIVAIEETLKLEQRLLSSGNRLVTLRTVPTGDHYYPMLDPGIPLAIEWLDRLEE